MTNESFSAAEVQALPLFRVSSNFSSVLSIIYTIYLFYRSAIFRILIWSNLIFLLCSYILLIQPSVCDIILNNLKLLTKSSIYFYLTSSLHIEFVGNRLHNFKNVLLSYCSDSTCNLIFECLLLYFFSLFQNYK